MLSKRFQFRIFGESYYTAWMAGEMFLQVSLHVGMTRRRARRLTQLLAITATRGQTAARPVTSSTPALQVGLYSLSLR